MTDTTGKPGRGPRDAASRDEAAPADDGKDRIAKVMARAGLCSRRDAEAWIVEGRVAVNGAAITSPALNVGPDDRITVDGQDMEARERTRLYLYHKPRGLVTTAKDPEGRPTVFDNLPPELPRVVSVGRLDINTEGLLLLTNDGGLARVLELPATGWLRRYRVRANGAITQDKLDALKDGITIDGVEYAGIEATLDRNQGANVWLSMGLREGKNREIKRVLEHLGIYVNRLIRLSFGPFQLGELAEGAVEEVRKRVLQDQLGPVLSAEAGVDWEGGVTAQVVTREKADTERKDRPAPPRSGPRGAPDRTEGPRAERPAPRARPHVSAMREERPRSGDAPRKRINRASTEDRKGRTVAVERVTVADKGRHTGDGGTSRNARNFARDRRDAEGPDEQPRRTFRAPVGRDAKPAAEPARNRAPRGASGGDRPATGRALKDARARPPRRDDQNSEEQGRRPSRAPAGREARPAAKSAAEAPRNRGPRDGFGGDRPATGRDGQETRARPPRRDGEKSEEQGRRPFRAAVGRDAKSAAEPPRNRGPRGGFGSDRPATGRAGKDGPSRSARPERSGDAPRGPRPPRPDKPRDGAPPRGRR